MQKRTYVVDNIKWNIIDSKNSISINGNNYPYELLQLIVSDTSGTCTFKNCNSKVYSRGLCNKHYRKARSLDQLQLIDTKKCTVDNCNEIHHAKGYCMNHYWSFIRRPRLVAEGKIKE